MKQGMKAGVLGVAVAIALAVTEHRMPTPTIIDVVRGRGGYEQAVRQQRSVHAPLLVSFRVDWCPHCRALDEMLEAYEVRSRLNAFIKVRINPEHGDAEKALFQGPHGAGGYPALFVQPDGGAPARLSTKGLPEQLVAHLPK